MVVGFRILGFSNSGFVAFRAGGLLQGSSTSFTVRVRTQGGHPWARLTCRIDNSEGFEIDDFGFYFDT